MRYWSHKLVVEYISSSKNKRNPTRETGRQSREANCMRSRYAIHASSHFFDRGGGRQPGTATQICIYIHHPIKKYIPARLLYTLGAPVA